MSSWLDAHHARWATSRDVLGGIVSDSGLTPTAFERIVVGQANEVYAVSTAEGAELVLRLAHRPDPKLFSEAAAIEVVRARGIPAPEVLASGTSDGDATAFLLERRLPGAMLEELLGSDPEGGRRALEPLGEIVAAIHDVPVEGFGNLSPSLQGTHDEYGEWFVDLFVGAHLPETLAAVADDAATTQLVHGAAAVIDAARPLLGGVRGRLAHGDLSPRNVLVDPSTGAITGIVDWEAVKGAPQANDFAWWTTVSSHGPSTLDALVRGYRAVTTLDDGFWELVELCRLRILTSHLGYAAKVGDHSLFTRARTALAATLGAPG